MQDNIFVEDLESDYNTVFFAMINYVLTEQKNLDWVFKTSFISATQEIRALSQVPAYIPDNQDYYLDYINEVKPYRSIIREFKVDYLGNDMYGSDVTDFDLPPYWDGNLQVYRSPNGDQSYDSAIQQSGVYSQWYDNYAYKVVDIVVEDAGQGFLIPPQIIIGGGGGTGATAVATINGQGGLESIVVNTAGQGYTSPPTVIINGTGTGAVAYAVLRNVYTGNNTGHNLVRSIATTLKFDRVGYTTSNTFVFWDTITSANIGEFIANDTIIVSDNNNLYQLTVSPWTANSTYTSGELVSNGGNTYVVNGNVYGSNFGSISNNLVLNTQGNIGYTLTSLTFPTTATTSVDISDFDNANDRIRATDSTIDLSLTQSGIEYPGVIVDGSSYTNTVYDTNIQSFYSNVLGVNPGDVAIDGGAYYDINNSHAPEELVPGRMFDALDMEVYDTYGIAFRVFEDLKQNLSYFKIGSQPTELSQDLLVTDKFIHLRDATKVPAPNPALGIPGVVFINGEKITYYRNYIYEFATPWTPNLTIATDSVVKHDGTYYLTTGNVYDAANFGNIVGNLSVLDINSLGQIRRAVDGTSPGGVNVQPWEENTGYAVGSYVYYSGNTYVTTGNTYGYDVSWSPNNLNLSNVSYLYYNSNVYAVTGNVFGNTFSSISSNLSLVGSGTDSGFTSISANLTLAFAGDNGSRHLANSKVVDSSILQQIPGTSTSNVQLTYANTYSVTSYVSYGLTLTGNITCNIGDYLSQEATITNLWTANTTFPTGTLLMFNGNAYQTIGNVNAPYFANISANVVFVQNGNVYNTVTMRSLQSVTNSNVVPVIVTAGSLSFVTSTFDDSEFDFNGGDSTLVITSPTAPTNENPIAIPSWTPNTTFIVGSTIQYNSNVYTVLGNVNAPYFANISSQSNNSANITLSGNANVFLNGNTTQYGITSNVLQVGDQWANSLSNQLSQWNGTSWVTISTSGTGLDAASGSPIYLNGNITTMYVKNQPYMLGNPNNYGNLVNTSGQVVVPAGAYVKHGNIWYSPLGGDASNGQTLSSQTTVQATFLKASN
jgi:hypothetical protein